MTFLVNSLHVWHTCSHSLPGILGSAQLSTGLFTYDTGNHHNYGDLTWHLNNNKTYWMASGDACKKKGSCVKQRSLPLCVYSLSVYCRYRYVKHIVRLRHYNKNAVVYSSATLCEQSLKFQTWLVHTWCCKLLQKLPHEKKTSFKYKLMNGNLQLGWNSVAVRCEIIHHHLHLFKSAFCRLRVCIATSITLCMGTTPIDFSLLWSRTLLY